MEMEILRGYMKIHREVQRKAQGERRIAQGGGGDGEKQRGYKETHRV